MMKKIICILHGLTDAPLRDLGGLTPLQKAHCKYLDTLAQRGRCVIVSPPSIGGLETAFLNMLGLKKGLDAIAQGPLEAYSLGYVLTPDQLAFSVRFISMGEDIVVDVSDSLLSCCEGKKLCRDLNVELGNLGCHFLHLKGPKAVLLIENPAFRSVFPQSYSNPIKAIGKRWDSLLFGEKRNEEVYSLMKRIFDILSHHEVNELKMDFEEVPANGLLIFNGGSKPDISLSPGCIDLSKVQLYTTSPESIGLARMLKMDAFKWAPEKRKYEHLIMILGKLDNIFLEKDILIIEVHHLWNSTYNGDLLEKVKCIEWLDRYVIKHLMYYCDVHDRQLTILPLRHSNINMGELLFGNVPAVVFSNLHKGREAHSFDENLLELPLEKSPLADLFHLESVAIN